MKNQTIDIEKALTSFFKLPQWIERSLLVGGPFAAIYVIYILLWLVMLIPFLGWVIGCLGFVIVMIASFVYWIYMTGYKYDLIRAEIADADVSSIKVYDRFSERMKHGLKIFAGNLVYSIPIIVLYFIGYALMFLPIGLLGSLGEATNDSMTSLLALPSMFAMLLGYLPIGIAMIYQMFQMFFIYPSMIAKYVKDSTISSMLQFKEIWGFIKSNAINLLLFMALTMGAGFVLYFAYLISFILVFVCIGIILAPVVFAIGYTFILHMQASMIGQISKINNTLQSQNE